MTKLRTMQSIGLLLVNGLLSLSAAAQTFTAQVLPTLGGPGAAAFGVNDNGDVVGAADLADDGFHACFWSRGEAIDLGTLPDGGVSTAFSINNDRIIVGRAQNADGVNRAVRWVPVRGGTFEIEDLGTLRGDDTGFGWATRVSNSGHIVGYATAESGSYHAFLWHDGAMTDLGTLNWTGSLAYSQALGVNNSGHAVGFAYRVLGGPEHGFLHNGVQQIDITPAGQFSLAQGHNLNDAGAIAGYVSSAATQGGFRAALRRPGQDWQLIHLLDGHTDSYGYDLNSSEWVVGVSFNPATPDFRGFLYAGDATIDLNSVTSGAPGQISDAADISDSGFIAATADGLGGPVALLLSPPTTTPCPADITGDGVVDLTDLATLLVDFGRAASGLPGDIDRDGDVDLTDLAGVLAAFGTACP